MKTKEIRAFLNTLNSAELRYLKIQMSMAEDARHLIADHSLSKEEFCELLKIKETEYESYLAGGFLYDIEKMSLMHTAYIKLRMAKIAKEAKKDLTSLTD